MSKLIQLFSFKPIAVGILENVNPFKVLTILELVSLWLLRKKKKYNAKGVWNTVAYGSINNYFNSFKVSEHMICTYYGVHKKIVEKGYSIKYSLFHILLFLRAVSNENNCNMTYTFNSIMISRKKTNSWVELFLIPKEKGKYSPEKKLNMTQIDDDGTIGAVMRFFCRSPLFE